MRHVILITALFLFCGHSAFARPQDSSDQDVRTILEKGLDAMGGEDVLRSINSVQMSLRGHEFTLDAFVREQSPKPVEYDDVEEILDFTGNRRRHQQTVRIAVESAKRTMTILTNRDAAAISFNLPDGSERKVPGRKIDLDEMREHLALSPLRVLFTASAASDLNRLPDMRLDGMDVHHLRFSWESFDVHIYLNAATGLLYQLETRGARPEDFSWAMWGGVVEQTTYYYWVQESNGVAFPRQWDISRNGLPYKSRMVTDLEFNPDMPSDSFAIDDDVRTAFKARLDGGNPPVQEVARPAPGIVAFQTWFRVVVAEQKDGVVIIDAPVSPELSQAVIDTVRSRYPGKPIKAAIIAAGAWTQFGGVAAFAQEGIPVYGPAYNADIFERFVTSRIGDTPWRFVPVEEPVRIGTGDEAVVVFPTGGSNTRGALLTLFPGHRLLYASSMVVPPGGSKASSWSLQEIRESIHRNGFDVENYFSMFLGVTPWNPVESSDN